MLKCICSGCCAAICQRRLEQPFPELDLRRGELQQLLQVFHQQEVMQRFPLEQFSMDVYVTAAGKVSCVASGICAMLWGGPPSPPRGVLLQHGKAGIQLLPPMV